MSALPPLTQPETKPESVRRFVLRYLAADLPRVAWFVFGQIVFVGLTVASTRLIGNAVELAGRDTRLDTFILRFAEILGVFALAVGFRWLADRSINRHTADAMAAIYQAGFEKCQGFDTGWHANAFAGSTARKITRAGQGYDIFVSVCYFLFLPSILLVLITAGTIMDDSALAAAAMLIGATIYFIVVGWFNVTRVMPLMEASLRPLSSNATLVTVPVWPCRIAMSCRPFACQTRTVRSKPAEAIHSPSPLCAAVMTSPEWRSYGGSTSRPVRTAHWRTVPSADVDTRREPSGLNDTATTLLLCPRQVATRAPVSASQMSAIGSSPPVATSLPSGLRAIAHRSPWWPLHDAISMPDFASNTPTRDQPSR